MRAALIAFALLAVSPLAGALPFPFLPDPATAPTHTWETVTRDARLLSLLFPAMVTVESLGDSVNGLDLWALRITSPLPFAKQRVLIDGDHHGNEQYGAETVWLVLYDLLEDYGTDPYATRILDTRVITWVPMVNPDGNQVNQRRNAHGVDLNRNWAYAWGGPGSGFRGPAPESEPEIKALAEEVRSQHWDLWLTMHTGVKLFLWPMSTTYTDPPDAAMFRELGMRWNQVTFGTLPARQGSDLYLASGTAFDYGYSRGIQSFTIEAAYQQGVTTYSPSELSTPKDGVKFLLSNIERIGARLSLDAVREGDDVRVTLTNTGWGAARADARVSADGQLVSATSVDVPALGTASVVLAGVPGLLRVEAEYSELFQPGAERHTLETQV